MARLRKAISYRRLERPHTRVSKFTAKSFVKTTHNTKISSFNMGNPQKDFPYAVTLRTKADLQIRDNAMNSAREASNRIMEKTIGAGNYYLRVNCYPHHILRENPLASGAGADRFSTGMAKSFGKPIGQAVRAKKGKGLFTIFVEKQNLELAKKALHRASGKLPCSCGIEVTDNPRMMKAEG
ncbi:TPA: 50S ribosomal protein L16 [Candidatus Woesearchaeota archaeon]|nr:50S ribosomal protein L16 [Candidatus Woesearchaeota archaeon]